MARIFNHSKSKYYKLNRPLFFDTSGGDFVADDLIPI